MTPTFSSQTESDEFLTLSKTIQAGDYAEALTMSKDMLERYPDNAYIYHNQIGAMLYLANNDYWGASRNYRKALELGFPEDSCEDNLWESAEDGFKFLIDGEEGFCSIMNTDDGSIMAKPDTLVEQYRELFPEGKYINNANQLLFIYDNIQGQYFDDRESIGYAYYSKFRDLKYQELLDELCDIYFK